MRSVTCNSAVGSNLISDPDLGERASVQARPKRRRFPIRGRTRSRGQPASWWLPV